jgi:hypothetical protein
MDMRTLTKLVLKLAGLYLLTSTLLGLPLILAAPDQMIVGNLVYLAVYVVVGLLLVVFPGVIINKAIHIEGADLTGTITAASLLRVGTILLGFYFTITAAYGLVFTFAKSTLFYRFISTFPGSIGPEVTPDDFAYLIAMSVQLILGLALWLGNQYVVRISGGFKDDC